MAPPVSQRPWWHRLRLSLRVLMLLVLVVGAGLGWVVRRATFQREAVKAIIDAGGTVRYDYEENAAPWNPPKSPPGPKWLVSRLGIDFFADVTSVTIQKKPATDAILTYIERLRHLKHLDLRETDMTDAGLAHLAGLTDLRTLSYNGSPNLTDAGLAHLSGLRRLERLWMGETPAIKGPGLSHLAGLSRLVFLNVDINTDAGLSNLSRLTALKSLMMNLPVTESALAELSRLTSLEDLAFGGDADPTPKLADLRSLKNLKMLQVWGPWFTDKSLAPVAEMRQLSTFFVADTTTVTPEGLIQLRKKRPDLNLGINGTGRLSKAELAILRSACLPLPTTTGP